jgi:hypothetical protein
MKSFWLGLALLLCLAPALAGNRADVNADQAVNAVDTVLLANIVAGNLDVANYNLETVVVVAPLGGDFTNPADAADWVTAQSPGPTHRFVILVTPGEYTVTRAIELPGYTTLQGYGRRATRILGNFTDTTYFVVANAADQVAIRDLTLHMTAHVNSDCAVVGLYNGAGCLLEDLDLLTENSWGPIYMIYADSCSGDFRNLGLTQGAGSVVGVGIMLSVSQVNIDHCQVKLTATAQFEMVGLYLASSMGVILRDSRISVTNQETGYNAVCVRVQGNQPSYAAFKDCHLQALATGVGAAADYYAYVADSAVVDTLRFFHCQLDGNGYFSDASLVRFGCSTSLGVAVP